MGRPEGHKMTVIDKTGMESAESAEQSQEGADDIETSAGAQDDNVVDEQGGDADPDGGAEGAEVGEGGGEDEGAADATEGDVEGNQVEDTPAPLAPLIERLDRLEERVSQEKAAPAPEPTEEEWAKHEENWGASRQTIKAVTGMGAKILNQVSAMLDARLAKLELGDNLRSLSSKDKSYADAIRYRGDVQKFLDKYDPKHWTNPELLQMAVVWARGLAAKSNISRVRKEVERNRKIAGAGRPASPAGGKGGMSEKPLTAAQRQAAAMMGGEKEYRRMLASRGKSIA